jgi:3-hydroxyacyl-CoA dehydrogenase
MNEPSVRSAAVLGAGVMGAAIAAHLANAGIPTLLLDMKGNPTEDETRRGVSASDRAITNRIAQAGLDRARKASPASFFTPGASTLVDVGNFDDDLPRLRDVDWVIEAVTENPSIKTALWTKVSPFVKPGAILSTNTSGLSVASITEALPPPLRSRFLATHFFNPPRYLKLLEIVPAPDTDPAVVAAVAHLGEDRLGKGIVFAKDTPNFIANRIGVFAMMDAAHLLLETDLTITEIDALTGTPIGRPKSGTFRTADVVGLDTLVYVAEGMAARLPNDPGRTRILPPPLLRAMIEKKLLGEKTGQGFYRRVGSGAERTILALDPASLTHVAPGPIAIPSLGTAGKIPNLAERTRALVSADDRGGRFLWKNLSATLSYAAEVAEEISDDLVSIDRAMCWGFGWEMGPFETWDAIGVASAAQRLAAEGRRVPPLVETLLRANLDRFYEREGATTRVFDPRAKTRTTVPARRRVIHVAGARAAGRILLENEAASLVDLGDDVFAFEPRTKMNILNAGVVELLEASVDETERRARGLVIGTDASNFCAGADLTLIVGAIERKDWAAIDTFVRGFQHLTQRLRHSSRPIVAAPRGLTLGGGCEIVLACDRVRAAAESYIGLVEVGAGLIPAGGGCNELVKRIDESVPADLGIDLFPFVRRTFEIVGTARVSGSASEARDLGFLRAADGISMNADHLWHDAKATVLALDLEGYRPPRVRTDIRVLGRPGLAAFRSALVNLSEARQITSYDAVVGDVLAWVLCGGDLSGPARVSEEYLLRCEREAFVRLCRDDRTRDRIVHLLKTGKPLRN